MIREKCKRRRKLEGRSSFGENAGIESKEA